ncbi:MAG: hypothetical protein QG608_3034 [Actinomycetota bacterium]|nr:hypothetical protein [Actinomycetota bacterium]
MGSSADIAGLLVQDEAELLYESSQTRIQRIPLADRSGHVIFKEPLDREASTRITHERTILERLSGLDGVPQLSRIAQPFIGLLLEDDGAEPVPRPSQTEPMEVQDVLDLAPQLAETLAAVHRRGVMHKDISPGNILLVSSPRRLKLIDFDLATTFAEERPSFTHHNEIVGTLAYMAPEQTGRTGRPLDTRADLYGLGATLYEFLTGRPPFGRDDPLQLVHDHLARVPIPPSNLRPEIPETLSAIVMRLLEKEPDERYQSADGLTHDLLRLREELSSGARLSAFPLGETDFPLRLRPPSRLVGRDEQIALLDEAFNDVMTGLRRSVLVTGAPGVGKTALLDELRPLVTEAGGLFVSGKFDQYHRGQESDGVYQALRGVSRLFLAESDSALKILRERLLIRLGPNAGLAAALDPDLRDLLGVAPESVTTYQTMLQTRLQRMAAELLRVVASPQQPLIMVVDDLQWAGPMPLKLLDGLLTDPDLSGVLLVGAYRAAEVGPTHPLTAMLSRWDSLGVAPSRIYLEDLPTEHLTDLLAQMLRMAPEEAAPLAETIGERTGGNPFDTVELLNELRRDGALTRTAQGWQWDVEGIHGHPGRGDIVELLTKRLDDFPPSTLEMVERLACLSGEVPLERLGAAADRLVQEVQEALSPCLEEGLLVMDRPDGTVRFRHDRVQQAVFGRMSLSRLAQLRLQAARRFAATPGLENFAAEHYLFAFDEVSDPAERQAAADLFRLAAAEARTMADHSLAERYVAAAIDVVAPDLIVPPGADPATVALVTSLATDRHSALFSLGRLEEADMVFERLRQLTEEPFDFAKALWLQVSSLINRDRPSEAIDLGLDLLARLGLTMPSDPAELLSTVAELKRDFERWIDETVLEDDLARPEYDSQELRIIARTINRIIPAGFFVDQGTMAWLVTQAVKLWIEHGPSPALLGPVGSYSVLTDHARGNRILRRILAVGEARGYEPDTSQARFMYSLSSSAWFEPVEESVRHAHRAREGLVQSGDLYFASHTYSSSIPGLFDCAPDLDEVMVEIEAALAFCEQIGNDQSALTFTAHRQLLRALRGMAETPGGFDDSSFREECVQDSRRTNPIAFATFHTLRALTAAIMGDDGVLVRHATIAARLVPFIQGSYFMTLTRLVHMLALARQIGGASGEEAVGSEVPAGTAEQEESGPPEEPVDREQLLAELDKHLAWLTERAQDEPENFLHLQNLIEAERARATGDVLRALQIYDAALRTVEDRRRPWHRAFLLERSGLLQGEAGLERTGLLLMEEALRSYERWGASGKVELMRQEFPGLAARSRSAGRLATAGSLHVSRSADTSHSGGIGAQLDLVGVLRASQEIISEIDLDRLRGNVITILSVLTGATSVRLLLWSEEAREWFVSSDTQEGGTVPIEEAARQGLIPLSMFRYAERKHETLLVEDAVRDTRFSRDPHFTGVARCSVLVVPVLARGALKAVLILENRLARAAFSDEGLDGVQLIASQLAVSLDNAMLNTSLERKVAERTQALGLANERLAELSHTDPLTGLANRRRLTEILHSLWHSAVATHAPLAALMIDIDHFKFYNDRYGHPAGDQCLRRVAAAIADCVRSSDLVARYGGEEFLVLLPDVGSATAQVVAHRIRRAVRALEQTHEESPFGVVTVSIGGISLLPSQDSAPERLVEEADAHLYRAKRSGRDQLAMG